MKNFIYCTTTAKGEQSFYLMTQGTKYFLFAQAFRRSNKDVFEQGISLFELRKLKKMALFANKFSGEIPDEWAGMKRLEDVLVHNIE